MQHHVAVKARLGRMRLDAAFTLTAPWTVLFGPSGCGKTSVLRAMGGVLRGADVVFERVAQGAAVELAGLAPECRSLAYAPQAGAIFPHLSVSENVGFGYDVCHDPPQQAAQVEEAISLFGLHALAERMPKELSGGERQRVNLARAFATPRTCLILLDEPFAGVDRARRDSLLPAMKAWCVEKRVQMLSVTHDVDEALLLDADVVRMDEGKVVGQGCAREMLATERERMLQALG